MTETDIQDLIKLVALNGDLPAFKKLYFYYYKRLFDLAKFYVKAAEGAEEIVDDTFVSLWERRSQLLQINNFTSYLYKATKNKSLNYIAKQQGHLLESIDDSHFDILDTSLNMQDQLIMNDLKQLVDAAIQTLPDQCRLIFKLVKEDDMAHKEVAELLNISVRTVEYHMSIAVKKLGEALNYSRRPLYGVR